MRRGLASKATDQFFGGVITGLLYRIAGIVVFAGLVLWDRSLFPPLVTGLGFVGVLIPLLFLEVRFVR
jgi:xanthine/uracil permease